MEYDGLYINMKPDGTMTKRIIFGGSQRKLPTATIKDEIISFSEQNFEPYLEMLTEIDTAAEDVVGSEEYKSEVNVDEFINLPTLFLRNASVYRKKILLWVLLPALYLRIVFLWMMAPRTIFSKLYTRCVLVCMIFICFTNT